MTEFLRESFFKRGAGHLDRKMLIPLSQHLAHRLVRADHMQISRLHDKALIVQEHLSLARQGKLYQVHFLKRWAADRYASEWNTVIGGIEGDCLQPRLIVPEVDWR